MQRQAAWWLAIRGRLLEAFTASGITYQALSKDMSGALSPSTIHRALNGASIPRASTIELLAEGLGVALDGRGDGTCVNESVAEYGREHQTLLVLKRIGSPTSMAELHRRLAGLSAAERRGVFKFLGIQLEGKK